MGRFLLKLILLWIFACLTIHSSAAELTKVANPSTAQKKSPVSHGRKDAPPSTGKSNNDTPSRNAIQLTAKTFSKEISDGNVWLIEFYTPWCRYCRDFEHSYDNVASTFHLSPDEGFRVGKVDCEAEKALRARFGVNSYPRFFVVDGWSVYEFEGTRSEASLMNFLRGGYKKQDPIPIHTSPMGPMGMLQGTLIYMGAQAVNFLESVQDYGIPPLLAGVVLSFVATVGGMTSVIIFAIITTPRPKND